MNTSGDAAEQIVRLTLEGYEVVLKITGSAAKNIAAFLYAALRDADKNKTSGRTRLKSMLRSGKELKIYGVRNSDLKTFKEEAKRYGVLYCALRDSKGSPDGMCDIMVRAEDAAKIERIVDRFKFATVETAGVKHEAEKKKSIEELLEKTAAKDDQGHRTVQEEKEGLMQGNPSMGETEKSPLSETSSRRPGNDARGTSDLDHKPSVRGMLKEMKASRRKKAEAGKQSVEKVQNKKEMRHAQPGRKSGKGKAR